MFNFLTGFLLGIIFTFAATLFGIYKLLLRLSDGNQQHHHKHHNSYKGVKHDIPKHNLPDHDVEIESCAWLNTLAAAICVEALSNPTLVEGLHTKLHEILNKPEDKPDVLGDILISDINMGTGLPQVDGVRVLSRAHDDSLHADVGIVYNGGASFTISTELWMNWPTPKFAALPVSLNASFDQFAGTLSVSCFWRSATSMRVLAFFRAPPVFQLRIGSTIGHNTKLVNVLQVSSLLENMIYSFVNKELVFPNGFEAEIEGGKVVSMRKLASAHRITEKGERSAVDTQPAPTHTHTHTHKTHGIAHRHKGERERSAGDLSHRGFTVSTQ